MAHFRFQRVPPAAVLEKHRRVPQVVADAIGASAKSRRRRRGMALLDEPFDLVDRHRRLFVLGAAQAQDAEHAVELVERLADDRDIVAGAELAGVDRGVQRAHQLEDRAERRRGVQVVLHRARRTPVRASSTRAGRSRGARRRA